MKDRSRVTMHPPKESKGRETIEVSVDQVPSMEKKGWSTKPVETETKKPDKAKKS